VPAADVTLAELAERHVEALQRLAADAAIAATTRVPHPYPPDGAATFVAFATAQRAAGAMHVFAVEHGGELVGTIGLLHCTEHDAELGFWIGVPFQRRGFAAAAVRAVLPIAFDRLRLALLWAEVLATNAPSLRVLARAGFAVTGERAHGESRWPDDVALRRLELAASRWRGVRC
jgi:ribosomal-protein-alanine N-acetyltransferase